MLHLIARSLVPWLLVAGCSTAVHPATAADHDEMARHSAATADAIETECWKALRHELTVDPSSTCWKAQDVRFVEALRDAAAEHRAAAARLRARSASR